MNMKIAVIGAGPAGLTAAYELSKDTRDVQIFEADVALGGLARSINLWGQKVDLGPHRFFSNDRRVNELWLEVVGRDYRMVKRQTRILYDHKLFKYPLEAGDALIKLGGIRAAQCVFSYAREHVWPTRLDGSFEAWVCQRFGRKLFEAFFKSYSEKLWGMTCSELDADFAAQRIKQFSLGAAIKSALFSTTRKKHRTLVDEFAYPIEGTGSVYERMASAIVKRGGIVRTATPVRRVLIDGKRVAGIELTTGEKHIFDQVISTMPLTIMAAQLPESPPEVIHACQQLSFRNTILVYLEVLNENPFQDNWIYVHAPDLQFGRVTNFRNWVPELHGDSPHTILALEYWCYATDPLWTLDEAKLIEQAQVEIKNSGLLKPSTKLGRGSAFRIPKCYPVYRRGYQEHLKTIRQHLDTIKGLHVIGRYGSFKYNNQDHSILMGRLAAQNVFHGKNNDLWGINTDYETYQEACSIAETGLVSVDHYGDSDAPSSERHSEGAAAAGSA